MSVDHATEHGDLQRRLSAFTQAVLVIVIAYLSAVVIAVFGTDALVATGAVAPEGTSARVAGSVLQFVGFGVGIVGYLSLRDELDLVHLRAPSMRDVVYIAAGVVAILLTAAVVGQVISRFGVSVAQNQVVTTGLQNPEFFLYMIPVSLLFVGPFEELVFRGAVQGLLRRAYRPWTAIGLASGLFGLVHWIALTGSGSRVPYVVIAAGLGLILGYVYERTDNLLVPASVHGVYNSVLFGVQYAVATGLVG
jgi:hypothetical protein